MKIQTARPLSGWNLTTVADLINKLKQSDNIGKEVMTACFIEYQGEKWKLYKVVRKTKT